MKTKYLAKAKDSFETKLNLFLFDHVIKSRTNLSRDHFINFHITEDLVLLYTATYWQQKRDYQIEGKTVDVIYHEMKELRLQHTELIAALQKEYTLDRFPSIFPFQDFEQLTASCKCAFCGISLEEVEVLADKGMLYKKNDRGWSLGIDRLNSNYEYTKENCVMACYWCNNAKTDEFTKEEFLEIAKAIRKVWQARSQL